MKITRAAAMAALFSTLVLAQGRPGGEGPRGDWTPERMVQMRVNMLAQRFNLTADQKTRATSIYTEAAATAANARTGMQEGRTALADAVKKNDVAAIERLSLQLGGLSGQMMAIDSKAEAAFYALLTPEQKAKYDQRPMGGGAGMGDHGMGRGRFADQR